MNLPCEVELKATGDRTAATILEMSEGGCFVQAEDIYVTFGSPVSVHCVIGGDEALTLPAIVRWTSERGFGAQFVALRVTVVAALIHFLADYEPATMPPPNPEVRRAPAEVVDRALLRKRWEERRKRDRAFALARQALESQTPPAPEADDEPASREPLGEPENEQRHLERALQTAREQLEERDEHLAQARLMLEERSRQVNALREALYERDKELERMVLERDALVAQLQALDEQRQRELVESDAKNLTLIRGIGPAYAAALVAASVTRIDQIAAWTDDDVERVAEQLGIAGQRIRKAGWVAHAQAIVADGSATARSELDDA